MKVMYFSIVMANDSLLQLPKSPKEKWQVFLYLIDAPEADITQIIILDVTELIGMCSQVHLASMCLLVLDLGLSRYRVLSVGL